MSSISILLRIGRVVGFLLLVITIGGALAQEEIHDLTPEELHEHRRKTLQSLTNTTNDFLEQLGEIDDEQKNAILGLIIVTRTAEGIAGFQPSLYEEELSELFNLLSEFTPEITHPYPPPIFYPCLDEVAAYLVSLGSCEAKSETTREREECEILAGGEAAQYHACWIRWFMDTSSAGGWPFVDL